MLNVDLSINDVSYCLLDFKHSLFNTAVQKHLSFFSLDDSDIELFSLCY